MEKYKKVLGKMENMLSRSSKNVLFKNFFGLSSLVISIFIVFFILNIIYGPDENSKSNKNLAIEQKDPELANEVIESLPRGILVTYESEKGYRLSESEFKTVSSIFLTLLLSLSIFAIYIYLLSLFKGFG